MLGLASSVLTTVLPICMPRSMLVRTTLVAQKVAKLTLRLSHPLVTRERPLLRDAKRIRPLSPRPAALALRRRKVVKPKERISASTGPSAVLLPC